MVRIRPGPNRIIQENIRNLETRTRDAIRNDKHRLLFHRSIQDLATLFLSPLLAIVMYFMLVQWAPTHTNVYILAVVSFGTGLVTDEIVRLLIRIVQSIIGSVQAPQEKPEEDLEPEDREPEKVEQKKEQKGEQPK